MSRFNTASRIPLAIVERFMERIEPIRMVPTRLLDLGSAAGHLRAALRKQYPDTEIISLERDRLFCAALKASRWRRLFREAPIVCALPQAIPLSSASVDMVCANLTWARAEELEKIMQECTRVLRAPGLLMLVAYGPQTLLELREVWNTLDQWEHMNNFADLHDIGDAMVRARLSDVVVDSERLTVEFEDVPRLLAEVRDIGGGNRATRRRKGLTTRKALHALTDAYPDGGGYVSASMELVFAHAWLTHRPGIEVAEPLSIRAE